jgi:hypothetical protein
LEENWQLAAEEKWHFAHAFLIDDQLESAIMIKQYILEGQVAIVKSKTFFFGGNHGGGA